jgi:DNA repair exonuclease SbcCD ATPase subunit
MPKLPDKLKIVSLQAQNFKRLRAVQITPDPDGNLVMITGRNGQGKSSVLDSITAALCGGKALPEQPIRKGEAKSHIVVDMGDLVVERTITQKGGELKVRNGAGMQYPSPQSLLDGLLGKLAFDPLAFMRVSAKEQVNQLLQVVDLGFDPAELEGQRKALYDERTLAGREVKRLEGALQSAPQPDLPADAAEVSVAALTTEYNQRAAENRQREEALRQADLLAAKQELKANDTEAIKAEIAKLQKMLAEAEHDATTIAIAAQQAQSAAEAMPAHDLSEITAQISGAEQHNAMVRQAHDYAAKLAELRQAVGAQDKLNLQIDALDARKAQALAGASMPVPGLGFTADGLTLNDIPLQQASASEQLRVSVAIAMALNPTLRVLTIRDGSLLDSESLKIIADMARQRDGYQVWIEQVDETGEVGIVIEDGMVLDETPDLQEVGVGG